jgi:hypothetical protein
VNAKKIFKRIAGAAAAVFLLGTLSVLGASSASAAAGGDPGSLALANVGKSAGYCAQTPTTNSLGGDQFATSCSGNGGAGEYWCADFARWVWANSGYDTSGLTAGVISFWDYGANNGTLHTSASYQPRVGDAVMYSSYDDPYGHVAIVASVNSDGSITTVNGDWAGVSHQGQAVFAETSSVVEITIPSGQWNVGDEPSVVDPSDGFTIIGYTTPVANGTGSTPPPVNSGNPYTPNAVCGSGFGVIDSHALTGADVYLLYNSSTGQNCVTTLASSPTKAVSMNATLAVQGGSSASNPGTYTYYAGPVTLSAPGACVEWGGSYNGSSWTSGWSHCGGGAGAPAPVGNNLYTPQQVCGAGYGVIDSHALSGATVYLLYSDTTGDNCVTTLATTAGGAVSMNATLAVEGGASGSNPGTFTYYAGPVYEHAPDQCVQWGGSYSSSSWTSDWTHCGTGSATPSTGNPYSPTQVCGSGYSVIDYHDLGGAAVVYLTYNSSNGDNCVVTLADSPGSAMSMNATLAVEGGASASNPGSFTYYAGPVYEYAPSTCVEWGGTAGSTTWTSGWTHCG